MFLPHFITFSSSPYSQASSLDCFANSFQPWLDMAFLSHPFPPPSLTAPTLGWISLHEGRTSSQLFACTHYDAKFAEGAQ